ncbi:MAG: hypothetical protein IKB64_01600 [Paludibacteraceae bacterium]|nr:hypothetical protein [Paludibacteraceae bacterium]MBR2492147.1 hypothetical protein [Paludibacteraceae bacterium]MBR3872035.1 hypothetical protein [Paludibacteraceae bacterium]MBR6686133.1 hypothetical protein [Paludibacteraceae bacterium]
MNNVLKFLLIVAACTLAYLCYQSVMTPIEFNEVRDAREKVIVERLIDIRRAETEYRNIKGDFTTSFDTLINFVKYEKAKIVLKEGELTDKQLEEGLTEREAVKQGLIKRDTTYVSMLENLFGANYPVDSLRYIPFSSPRQEFTLEKAEITTGSAGIKVKVMAAKAPYVSYLNDLDKQELINLVETTEKLEKFPGLKFGDIEQANNNAGNWE